MKKLLSLVLALIMLLVLLAGCGGETPAPEATGAPAPESAPESAPEAAPANGESDTQLRAMLTNEPAYVSPLSGLNQYCAPVIYAICEPLIMNVGGELSPCLATEWEWVDEMHLRVTLRDEVYFHNGEKLKASDVVYSFKTAAQGEAASYYTRFDLDNFVIEDDLHVVIALAEPCTYLTEVMYNYPIVSEKAIEDLGGVSAAAAGGDYGTGPYKFVEWEPAQYISVTRNENYWDAERVNYYKDIQYTFNAEGSSRIMSLESREVDVITEVPTASLDEVDGVNGITLVESSAASVNSFIMNNTKAPFDDERVREAFYLLIDPAAVRAVAASGRGDLVDSFWAPSSRVYSQPEGATERAVNVERAKELLAEAGYADGLEITITSFTPFATINEVIQANLLEGGVVANIEPLDQGAYFETYFAGSYQCNTGIIDASDYNLALNKLDGRVGPAVAMGGIVASYPELEAILDVAYSALDDEERLQAFADVQQYIFDHHNVIGLYARCNYAACQEGITGVQFLSSGQYPLVHDMHPIA